MRAIRPHEACIELAWKIAVGRVAAAAGQKAVVLAAALESPAHTGWGVDCQATNFHPCGVFAQALRNISLSVLGWPLISASMCPLPVTSATSPKIDRKSTRLNSSHLVISYAVFCLKKKTHDECHIVKQIHAQTW